MDENRKKQDPTLVCTCSELYVNDITEAIEDGEEEYNEILQYNFTLPRCGMCKDHVDALVKQSSDDDL